MKRVNVLLADGFEEVEALTVVDLLRRAKVYVDTVSIMEDYTVRGSHGINVQTEDLFEEVNFVEADMVVLPGGMPGRGPRPHDGGMPPMGGPRPEGEGMRGMPMGAGPKEKQEDLQKRIEKKNKKMKKILTEAQYDQWLGMKQKPLPEPPKPEEVPSEEK